MVQSHGMPFGKIILEAFIAWCIAAGLVVVAAYAAGVDPFNASSYARADSGHYLRIANWGYEFFSCARLPDYDPTQWCGNTGWMPGYPLLIRLITTLDIGDEVAGSACSCVFFFGSLVILRLLLQKARPAHDNAACFLAASVFPGGIYFFSIFPISFFMFLALGTILLLATRHYWFASLLAAAGAFVYSTGFLLSGVVGVAALCDRSLGPAGTRLIKAVQFGLVAFCGLLAVLVLHQLVVGQWNAFFLVQAKYGHGIHNPVGTILNALNWKDRGNPMAWSRDIQTILVVCTVLTALASLLRGDQPVTRIEWLAATHVGLLWLFPLIMGTHVSLTRAEANLLPLVVLLGRSPAAVQGLVTLCFAFLAFEVDIAFFKSVLV